MTAVSYPYRMKLMVWPTVVMLLNSPNAEQIAITIAVSAQAISAWPQIVLPARVSFSE